MIFRKIKFSFLASLIFFTCTNEILAQDITLISKEETYRTEVPVSGSVIVGVMMDAPGTMNTDNFSVYLPAGTFKLCTTIQSINGQYLAQMEHQAKISSEGWFYLPLNSEYKDQIEKMSHLQLAARVYAGKSNDCSNKGEIYISAWNISNLDTANLQVFVNSSRYRTFLRDAGPPPASFDCERIRDKQTISYDTLCSMPLNKALSGKLSVFRKKMGQVLPAVSFELSTTKLN